MTTLPRRRELHVVELDLHPNEASGLVPIRDRTLLAAHGWHVGFWTVLDEGPVEDCIALIGRCDDGGTCAEGWEISRLSGRLAGGAVKTDDAEAVAGHDGWIYVIGSHFGKKTGPLQRKRAWVARFREEAVRRDSDPADSDRVDSDRVDIVVVRDDFRLHRIINDGLREHGVALLPVGERLRRAMIDATVLKGIDQDAEWRGRVQPRDTPINIEGATFRQDGNLLFGLRYPVAADGSPLLVEVEGIERLFHPEFGDPVVRAVWLVEGASSPQRLMGVRDMSTDEADLDLILGNLDSTGKGSILLEDHPAGADAHCGHWRVTLPPGQRGGRLPATLIRDFPELFRVEGIARDHHGNFFYVSDEEDAVLTRFEEFDLPLPPA